MHASRAHRAVSGGGTRPGARSGPSWAPTGLQQALGLAFALLSPGPLAQGLAYVSNQNADTVSLVDLDQGRVVHEFSTPGAPAGVAVCGNPPIAYVSAPNTQRVYRLDLAAPMRSAPIGAAPLGIACGGPDQSVYVADWDRHEVVRLDGVTLAITARIATGRSPSGLVVSPDGMRLIVAERDDDTLGVYALPSGEALARIGVGERPFGVTLTAEGETALVANVHSNDVSRVDLQSYRETGRVQVGESPYAIAIDPERQRAFVSNQHADSVAVIDLKSFELKHTLPVGEYPEGIDYYPAGDAIVVANWFSNELTVIDAGTLELRASIGTGDGSRSFGRFIGVTDGLQGPLIPPASAAVKPAR